MLTIYKASAGSGKTYTLAYEYIRLLLGVKLQSTQRYRLNLDKYSPDKRSYGYRHRHILAITFTNKATEEMKRRIIDNLHDLATNPSNAEYGEKLVKEFGCTSEELQLVASRALRQILFDYNYFNISTIDSFFQKVLRIFAREIKRPGDYNVELDNDQAVTSAVAAMLDDFNADINAHPELYNWIRNYMASKMEEGEKANLFNRSDRLFSSMVKMVAHICEEGFDEFADDMREYLKYPTDGNKSKLEQLIDFIKKYEAQKRASWAKQIKDLFAKNPELETVKWYVAIKRAALALKDGLKIDTKDLREINNRKSFQSSGQFLQDKNKNTDVGVVLAPIFAEYIYFGNTLKSIKDSLHSLRLLSFAWKYIDELSVSTNTILLSSTNSLLKAIIGKDAKKEGPDETPFVYERLGVDLHHFLIDEFQDTSTLQWYNLYPLVLNSLSDTYDNLIIGDEKQSIYRFRNSDSSLLHEKVKDSFDKKFPPKGSTTQVKGENSQENTNYRSSRDIVRFNNTLFKILAQGIFKDQGQIGNIDGFENVVQAIKKVDLPGYVHFIPTIKPESKKSRNDSQNKASEESPIEIVDPRHAKWQAMCDNILREHNAGGCPWSRIAILVDTKHVGGDVINYMSEFYPQIPVMSGESLFLEQSSAVSLIVSMLKIIDKVQNAVNPTSSDDNPFPSFSDVCMMMSRYEYFYSQNGHNASKALEDALSPKRAGKVSAKKDMDSSSKDVASKELSPTLMQSIQDVRDCKPASLISLTDIIIHQRLSPEMIECQLAYILAFQDIVLDFSSRANASLHSFLRWWDQNGADISIQGSKGVDAVAVMTVHKSKGLEFDCVHIPNASWDIGPKPRKKSLRWVGIKALYDFPKELLPPALLVDIKDFADDPNFSNAAQHEILMMQTDVMNKTYVAYTRAIKELLVYYEPNTKFGSLLTAAFKAGMPAQYTADEAKWMVDLNNPDFLKDNGEFEMGTPLDVVKENAVSQTTQPASAPKPLKPELPISYNVILRDDSAVLTTVDTKLDSKRYFTTKANLDDYQNADETARNRGIQLHDILSRIDTPADIDQAVADSAGLLRIDPDTANERAKFIKEMLATDHPEVKNWFSPSVRVLKEQSLYIPEPSVSPKDSNHSSSSTDDQLLTNATPILSLSSSSERRPDRVVIYADGSADVIDYKFTTDKKLSHQHQVQLYAQQLKDMGYAHVRGFLWYALKDSIVEVPLH